VGTFAVDPEALEDAAGQLIAAGEEIRSLAASLDGLADSGGATGHPTASSAYARMCAVWAAELLHLGESAASTGRNAAWAGRLYRAVDQSVMPEGD
jgi:uncharacterized protein YukE